MNVILTRLMLAPKSFSPMVTSSRRLLHGLDDVVVAGAPQRLPSSGAISLSLGLGCAPELAGGEDHPGVQKRTAAVLIGEGCCTGCSLPFWPVLDGGDGASFALDREQRAGLDRMPSIRTVQAPHWLVSQPTWVPVSPSSSRRKWTSSIRGSTSGCGDSIDWIVTESRGTPSGRRHARPVRLGPLAPTGIGQTRVAAHCVGAPLAEVQGDEIRDT